MYLVWRLESIEIFKLWLLLKYKVTIPSNSNTEYVIGTIFLCIFKFLKGDISYRPRIELFYRITIQYVQRNLG
jgi:hypothetical protein